MKKILTIEYWYQDDAMYNKNEPKEKHIFVGTDVEWGDFVKDLQSNFGASISIISKRKPNLCELESYDLIGWCYL